LRRKERKQSASIELIVIYISTSSENDPTTSNTFQEL
jgi:hypothetical protein